MKDSRVISYNMNGNSFPIVLKQENEEFFVKLREGMCGEYSLLCEWFGNKVGQFIGLNTRQPFWIQLTDSIQLDHIYIEVRELIEKSFGVNIGFKYIKKVEEIDSSDLVYFSQETLIDVFLLDILMLNIDRTESNTNLLDVNGVMVFSDFDSSLLFNEIIKERDLSGDSRILHCLKANPLYQKVGSDRVDLFLDRINQVPFDRIISEIPRDVLNDKNRNKILNGLREKMANGWKVKTILKRLDHITLETNDERNQRIRKNREKLEQLVSSTHLANYKSNSIN